MDIPTIPKSLYYRMKHLDYTYDKINPWLLSKLNRTDRSAECVLYTKELMYDVNARYNSDFEWYNSNYSLLSRELLASVASYQNMTFLSINYSLRGFIDEFYDDSVRRDIINLDTYLSIAPTLKHVTPVYRHAAVIGQVVDEESWETTKVRAGQASEERPDVLEVAEGMVVREPGYMSTTDNITWTSIPAPGAIDGYIYMILLPKGMPYINPDVHRLRRGDVNPTYTEYSNKYDTSEKPISFNEAELLLPRGLTLKIVKIIPMNVSNDTCGKTFFGDKLVVCVVLPDKKPVPKSVLSVGYNSYDNYLLFKSTYNPILKHRFGLSPLTYKKESVVNKMLEMVKDNQIVSVKYENQVTTIKFLLYHSSISNTIVEYIKCSVNNDISSLIPIYRKTYSLLRYVGNKWTYCDLPHLLYLFDTKCTETYSLLQHNIGRELSSITSLTPYDKSAIATYVTVSLFLLRRQVQYSDFDTSSLYVHDLGHYVDIQFFTGHGQLPLVIRIRHIPIIVDNTHATYSSPFYENAERLLKSGCGIDLEPYSSLPTTPVVNVLTLATTMSKLSSMIPQRVMANKLDIPQVPVHAVIKIHINDEYHVVSDYEYINLT